MKNNLQAGLYKKCITPHINGPVAGGFNVPLAKEILDDLYVNALVIDDGKTEVAIVSVDIIGIPFKITKTITEGVNKLCNIPSENIIISATHNHTSTSMSVEGNDSYTEYVKEAIISAIYMAQKRKQPIKIGVGKDINDKYVFNRRLKRPDGSIVMNWINRDLLQDCDGSGIVDPELIDVNWKTVIFPLLYMGIICSFAAQTIQVIAQRHTSATAAGLIMMLEGFFGSVFSVAFGFEAFTSRLAIGGTIIMVSLMLMEVDFTQLKKLLTRDNGLAQNDDGVITKDTTL
jgi:hypothetical protein